MDRAEVAAAYDARAEEYVERLGSLAQMTLHDRSTIETWRDATTGRLLDAGSGPGHWTDLLSDGGRREVLGVDGTPRFVALARQRFPHLDHVLGDLTALPVASDSVGGVLAWYSVIHTPPAAVPALLAELARVLVPGGSLLLGFVDGEAGVPFDHTVVTAYHWSAEALGVLLAEHGFVVERAASRQDPDARRRHGELVARLGAADPGPLDGGRARAGRAPEGSPPDSVVRSFGSGPELRRLPGGQGTSWRAGSLVLKPGDGLVHPWLGEALGGLVPDGVRVAVPVAASDGRWTVDGWGATSFEAGSEPDLSRVSTLVRVVEAGRAFHRAVAHLGRPAFVDARDDPWAVADRVAWGEQPMRFVPELADVAARLLARPGPPGTPQLVHGDLTGNVLLAADLPPAVIDVSPYWRPPSYAEGVVVADALCHHGADGSVVPALGVRLPAVARALLFRVATTNALVTTGTLPVDLHDEARRYERAARAIGV